ncbi:protein of unknown function [Methylocaldum szegediense]|uniref:Uncharacterized protein n=1 Tax=Methylocaldum szegediense TaxID=73780 RepID=A0ABM9HYY9_9GAMM|nr:protein of unknown function [Methylocaldum szegediense]
MKRDLIKKGLRPLVSTDTPLGILCLKRDLIKKGLRPTISY